MKTSQLFDSVRSSILSTQNFSITDTQKSYKGSDFIDSIEKQAKTFLNLGLKAGDRIMIPSGRGLDFWRDVLAAWSIEGIIVPIAADIAPHDKSYIVELVNPKVINGEIYSDYRQNHKVDAKLQSLSRTIGAIIFTSGSTGRPKGVVLSADALNANAIGTKGRLGLTDSHKMILPIPSHFVSGISHLFVCSLSGTSLFIDETVRMPATLVEHFRNHKLNALGGAPLHLRWISELPKDMPFSWLMSSGDRLGGDLASKLLDVLPELQLRGVYGLTELGGRFCVATNEDLVLRPATVGAPIAGLKLEIDNSDENADEGGEVVVSGSTLMEGYLANILETENYKPIQSFYTGDIGVKIGELLELRGRSDDVFKVSGLKVSSPEVSEVLMRTGLLSDVYVTQVEHSLLGTVVGAYYTSRDREVKLPELLPHLKKALPGYCIPKVLKRVSAIPRTGSGKINRRQMRAILEQEGGV